MTTAAIDLLKELSEAPGVSGSEQAVRAIFQRELKPCGKLKMDRLGSAICERKDKEKTKGPTVMLTAHFDEVGFAVQTITRKGLLKIVGLGGWWTHTLLSQRVIVQTQDGREHLGVISSTPPHFLSDGQRDKVLGMEQLFIDVGAADYQQATEEFGIALGDAIVPDSKFTVLSNQNLVIGKAFDNRVGCAVMIETMRRLKGEKLNCALSAVGTVQEEVGCRGAVTAAAVVKPDVAIILEGTPADDAPGMDASEAQGALGKGPQLRMLDPTALMSRPLVKLVEKIAKETNVPYQIAVRRSGGTDAKSIHLAGEGVPCIVIGVPARYIHSHQSMLDLRDYEQTIELTVALMKALNEKNVAALLPQ